MPIQKLSANFEAPLGVEANNYQYNGKENEDFGLQWMDYGARWYNPQINRWGQIDPLAEKYYAWNGYNYVLGNPVKLIDPDGRNTAYYNEEGQLLHYSYDDLPNAVTVLQESNLKSFLTYTSGFSDASYSQEGASQLRQLGISYMVDGIIEYTNRASKERDATGEFFEKNKSGNYVPARIEVGNYLYTSSDGKTVSIGSSNEDIKGFQSSPGITLFEKPNGSDGRVAKAHFHPANSSTRRVYRKDNNGNMILHYTAPGDNGPSPPDKERHTAIDGYYNIVTGENGKGGSSIYLYDKNKKTIEVPFSLFSTKK